MGKLLHSKQQLLTDWSFIVSDMFNETAYQVGTSVLEKEYRDVDIRIMLKKKEFNSLKKIVDIDRLNLAISLWGQQHTGLPIDFQLQNIEYANKHHKGVRSAVGVGGVVKGDGDSLQNIDCANKKGVEEDE